MAEPVERVHKVLPCNENYLHHQRSKETRLYFFLWENWSTLYGTQIGTRLRGTIFFSIPTKFRMDSVVNGAPCMTRAVEKWHGYFMGNYRFLLIFSLGPGPLMQGSCLHVAPLAHNYCTQTNGGPTLSILPSPNNAFLAFLTQVSRFNISFKIGSKHGEFRGGSLHHA